MIGLVPVDTDGTQEQVLFGLSIAAVTLDDALRLADDAITSRRRLLFGAVNAAKIVKLKADEVLRRSLLEADVLLADGQSVVWASRLLGRPLPERVAGIDLFESLLAQGAARGQSVYLFGAKPEVLERVCEVVGERWPGLRIAGSRHGYYAPEESEQIAADIAASGADMLFLGITTPYKEIFLGQHADALGVPVLHGVGGSFDVMAGVVKRAPARWQRWGMEWLYRVVQEPRRLWRRYLVTNTLFLFLLVVERIRRRPAYRDQVTAQDNELGNT